MIVKHELADGTVMGSISGYTVGVETEQIYCIAEQIGGGKKTTHIISQKQNVQKIGAKK